jgi:hypothetical protein
MPFGQKTKRTLVADYVLLPDGTVEVREYDDGWTRRNVYLASPTPADGQAFLDMVKTVFSRASLTVVEEYPDIPGGLGMEDYFDAIGNPAVTPEQIQGLVADVAELGGELDEEDAELLNAYMKQVIENQARAQ